MGFGEEEREGNDGCEVVTDIHTHPHNNQPSFTSPFILHVLVFRLVQRIPSLLFVVPSSEI